MKKKEIEFNKYKERGSLHWREMVSRDVRVFNAYQQARYEWILKLAGNIKGKKVLDIGSGDGSFTYVLAKMGAEVIGIDNEEQGVKFANENLETVNKKGKLNYKFTIASAYNLPFDDESFDVVVSCEVIEHLNDPQKMCSEAARVLKKGGKFVITTPYRMTERPQDKNHVREYYPSELKRMISEYFEVVNLKETHHMLWRSLYVHAFRLFGRRPIGRWIINLIYFIFRWNPFMIDYKNPTKFDTFSTICVWGEK